MNENTQDTNVEPIRPEDGSNSEGSTELADAERNAAILAAAESIISDKIERSALTANISKTKSRIAGMGIPKASFNQALKELETFRTEGGEEKVKREVEAYWIARGALGLGGEPGMFDEE